MKSVLEGSDDSAGLFGFGALSKITEHWQYDLYEVFGKRY
jgi:hypothetical protein